VWCGASQINTVIRGRPIADWSINRMARKTVRNKIVKFVGWEWGNVIMSNLIILGR
jgi:hypothetical protein